MNDILIGFFFTAWQTVHFELFSDIFSCRKHAGKAHWQLFVTFTLCYALTFSFVSQSQFLLNIILCLGGFYLLHMLLYNGSWLHHGLIAILFSGFLRFWEATYIGIYAAIRQISASSLMENSNLLFCIALPEHIVMLVFLILLRHFSPVPSHNFYADKWMFPVIAAGFSAILLQDYLINAFLVDEISAQFPAVAGSVLLFMNLLTLCTMNWLKHMTQVQTQNAVLQKQLFSQSESLEALDHAYAFQRKMTHEYAGHLNMLQSLLASQQYSAAQSYLSEILQQHTERILAVNTHHAMMDALLNQKAFIARKNNIEMRFIVNDLSPLKIKASDLTVIVNNLIDNAIEASLKLPSNQREIEISTTLEDTFVFFIRNRSNPVLLQNGEIVTSKQDTTLHGFGLKNIRALLSAYPDSIYGMDYQDGWFYYTIEMPNMQCP